MTLPSERARAILFAEKFLLRLCDPKVTPGLPKAIRDEAKAILRHYPNKSDLNVLISGWGDAFVGFAVECPIKLEDRL